ncbi:uncharacterized protein LOC130693602 [Daphnia carinata]|uniref:uncharacterized protein LOC130693602 n=1 Tax=Daphnia carinata TaxID=120202 RepID=UPI00257E6154|nr:uncharacterized protein LOC130693602 [Daphnia carinata]XP_059350608.1 uncharacterized protein LOC130693602 [Daphnia carinata]
MADKIQVAVRVRPVLFQKKDVEVHWACEQGMVFQIEPGTKKRIGNPYLFDQVFGTETQNYKIFTALVQPLIDSAMNGFNVTVLAYGQTASGKTYTMMGSQKELGIVQLAVNRIFTLIEQNPERAFLLRCSYIEIYNESISDLLSSSHQKLKVQELAEGHVVVHNLIETNVNTPDAVLKLMQQGNKQRKVGGTSMNERSSRSHTIFRIIVESLPRDEADRSDAAVIVSHINLVDLAGSEKASQTNATGDRFREGCAINTSLSALSLVIKQLSEGEGFVNFRDSKLTHILRASLGGNARTAIICNVTPTVLDETSSTLKFACSAKAVQNQPHVNEVLSDQALLRKYNNYIKDLEKKLKEKELEKKPEAIEEMQRLLQEKDMKINELKEQLVVSSCGDVASGRPDNSLSCAQRNLRRMTWGGNRLRQELNLLGPAVLEVNTPPVPSSERVPRTVAQVFASRQRSSNLTGSDMAIDEASGDAESFESETFLPAEMVFSSVSDPVAKVSVGTMTDAGESPFKLPSVPSTPVPVLRERVQRLRMTLLNKEKENEDLREELEDLTNFTRLEQEIGVHPQVTAKNVATPESADQLHRALQTANDMEVLYLDTHRKLSELQTEFRTKEAEHEAQIRSQQADFQERLESETNERKRVSKELSDLKDKFYRLERDHSESDTHLQVISERYAKREVDLRNTLQEAWNQLEQLGQNPTAIQQNFDAKQRLVVVEQELLEMHKRNDEAQSQIRSLTDELRHLKDSALQMPNDVAKNDDEMHDSSLSGMCLADELRDVFANDDCSFVSRARQTRKRPSSILSVALEKMDQSTCILESSQLEIEPSKKTRLAVTSDQSDELDVLEIKEIREYLIELQSVLLRYETDYDAQSQEKEALRNQLQSAQNELAALRQEQNKMEFSARQEESSTNKFNNSREGFDSSCFMGDPSISISVVNMEQSCGSDEEFVSLREQLGETCGSLTAHEVSESAAQVIQKVDDSNKRQQELEEEVSQMAAKIHELKEELASKTIAVEQSLRSLETAQSTIQVLEQRSIGRQQLISSLDEFDGKILLLHEESTVVSNNVDSARKIFTNIRNEMNKLSEQKDVLELQVRKANENLEAAHTELSETLERLAASSELEQKPNIEHEKTYEELSRALEQIEKLKLEFDLKTAEVHAAQNDLKQTRSRMEEVEQSSFEKIQLEELVEKLTSQLDSLQDALDSKTQELADVQEAEKEALLQKENFKAELEKKLLEISQAHDEITAVHLELDSTTADLKSVRQELEEVRTNSQEFLRLKEQLETEKKEVLVMVEELKEQIRIKSIAMEEAKKQLEELQGNDSEVDCLRNALEKNRGQVEELQVTNKELVDEISVAKIKIEELSDELQSKINILSATDKEASSKQQELSVELDIKLQIIDELELSLKEAHARLIEVQSMKEIVQNDLAKAKRRIEDLEENLESECDAHLALQRVAEQAASIAAAASKNSLEEKEKTEHQLLELHGRVNELTRTLEEKTTALEAAKAEVMKFEHSSRVTMVAREDFDALQSDWKEAIEQVSRLEASLEEKVLQVENLSRNMESFQSRALALQLEKQGHSTQVASLERNIEDLVAQNANLSKEIEQYQSDIQSKEEKLVSLGPMTEKILMLQARLEETASKSRQMSCALEKKEEEVRCLHEELSHATDSQLRGKEDLKHTEQRLHESHKELESIRSALESMQSANDDLLTQLSCKENLNENLRKDMENLTQRFDMLHSKLQQVQSEKSSLSDRIQSLETELECRDQEIGDIRSGLDDIQKEREISSQLKQRLNALQVQYNDAVNQCQKLASVRDEILEHQERSRGDILRLNSKLQLITEEKAALEQNKLLSESQKNAILCDYENLKTTLCETESQLRVAQGQRDDFSHQIKILNDQIGQVRAKLTAFESNSNQVAQRQMEETIDGLKREIADTKSKSEVLRLNFETEENARKKKTERLEKELDSVKQQYLKCKEQLRLLRHGPNEEATVSLPKHRVSISVESISIQTDPIADKGFGFRWQMEQYVSDNERLRKKVSDLGERMEFYKEKLIKYRTMYFQMTGQDPQRPPSSSSNNSSQPLERQSSISAGSRENTADRPLVEAERNLRTKTSAPITTGNPLPASLALQEQHQEEMKARMPKAVAVAPTSSTRWATGAKKESLTKEEMEKINNCNPS